MTIREIQQSHLDFLKKMVDATMGTLGYAIWANAYDSYINSMITMESSSMVEHHTVNVRAAGSSPASPAKYDTIES